MTRVDWQCWSDCSHAVYDYLILLSVVMYGFQFTLVCLHIIVTDKCSVGDMFGRVCLSLCPDWALIFVSIDLETSFLVCRCIFKISGSSSYIEVIGSRSQSKDSQKRVARGVESTLRLNGKCVSSVIHLQISVSHLFHVVDDTGLVILN